MTQKEALAILASGQSVLLTGAAGSGKTYVLNRFIERARDRGKRVAVTATTGLAATHLNGTTIHSWSGLGIRDFLPPGFAHQLPKSRQEQLLKTDILVIDEISMLHDYRLDLVDQVLRMIRVSNEPFGGVQVILCGDFFQLPPVNRFGGQQGGFVTRSQAWQNGGFEVAYLEEQHRQEDDPDFSRILNAVRAGEVDQDHAERLRTRMSAELGEGILPTRLHTTNADVDAINARHLEGLPGMAVAFGMTTSGKANYVEQLKKSCLAPAELWLKIGALVMCIKNSQDRKYVNGSLGVVTSFDPETGYPNVKLTDGRTILMQPDTWELTDGDTKRASLTQLPLRLAWAITVHKSQGMTLDAARIDLSRAFVPGMGYVALSRVRSLASLSLDGLNGMALRVSDEALAIDEDLRSRSSQAVRDFDQIIADFDETESEPKKAPIAAPKVSWTAKIEKMRETYPNAYKPWSEDDDRRLTTMHAAAITTDELTRFFGRHPGSIHARLRKLLGDDINLPA